MANQMQVKLTRSFPFSQICGLAGATQVLLLGLLITFLTYNNLSDQLERRLQQDATRQTQRLALTLAHSLIQQDRISLNLALAEWQRGEEISALRVLDTDGQVIAEIGKTLDNRIHISRSITQDDQVVGVIQADINLAAAHRDSGRYLSLALIATGLSAMLAGLISYFLAERVADYVRKLSRTLQGWHDDEPLQLPPPPPPVIEFDQLHTALNNIREQERQRLALEKALGKFLYNDNKVPVKATTYQRCALIYIEISELDVLQSRLSAEELAQALGEYHRLLNQAAKLYNGKLDRYQGDGIVMIFGLNDENERDTLHCVYAAQLCLGLMQYARQKNPHLAAISFRAAAHWGPVLLAPLEQGDESHYSLIGDTLYWASHLARRSEEYRLLASQTLLGELPPEYGLEWEEGPMVADLQGNQQANFWLTALPENSRTLIDRQILHIANMTEQV